VSFIRFHANVSVVARAGQINGGVRSK
jgi:hypothetical protein